MDSSQDQAAVELLEGAILATPGDAVRHFWLANAYGAVARNASIFKVSSLANKAGNEFETAVRLDPNFIDARRGVMEFYLMLPGFMGGGVDKARDQATEIRKRDGLAGHRAFAAVAAAEKDMIAARAEYAAAVNENPDSPVPHCWYGIFLMLTEKNYQASAEELDAALRIDASYMPAYFQIGHLAALSGARLARGEEALQKYLAYRPGDDDPPLHRAHYWLGFIYEKQGRKANARDQFQAALRLRPGDNDAREGLKRVS
jgi:tetratricopeptide (TPR) repeat protein